MNFARRRKEERRVLFGQNNFFEFLGHTYSDDFFCSLRTWHSRAVLRIKLQKCPSLIASLALFCPFTSKSSLSKVQNMTNSGKTCSSWVFYSTSNLPLGLISLPWFRFPTCLRCCFWNVLSPCYSFSKIWSKNKQNILFWTHFNPICALYLANPREMFPKLFINLRAQSLICSNHVLFIMWDCAYILNYVPQNYVPKKMNFYSTMCLFCSSCWSNPLNWSDCVFARSLRQHSTKSLNQISCMHTLISGDLQRLRCTKRAVNLNQSFTV